LREDNKFFIEEGIVRRIDVLAVTPVDL